MTQQEYNTQLANLKADYDLKQKAYDDNVLKIQEYNLNLSKSFSNHGFYQGKNSTQWQLLLNEANTLNNTLLKNKDEALAKYNAFKANNPSGSSSSGTGSSGSSSSGTGSSKVSLMPILLIVGVVTICVIAYKYFVK